MKGHPDAQILLVNFDLRIGKMIRRNSWLDACMFRRITLAVFWLILLGVPSAIIAQDSVGIEEVVVTAQRREQNLQDVPISINAFTSDAINKFMFNDVGDYLIRTPNASFSTDGAKSRRRLSIRGVTNFLAINNTLKSSTFGFYVDDFSVAASTSNPLSWTLSASKYYVVRRQLILVKTHWAAVSVLPRKNQIINWVVR